LIAPFQFLNGLMVPGILRKLIIELGKDFFLDLLEHHREARILARDTFYLYNPLET